MKFEGHLTANLPAIDFVRTANFYQFLGFDLVYHSSEWMILKLGEMVLEFFHHPHLLPQDSWHSACIRVNNVQDYFHYWSVLDWSLFPQAKLTEIQHLPELQQFCIIDINGSLLRCLQLQA